MSFKGLVVKIVEHLTVTWDMDEFRNWISGTRRLRTSQHGTWAVIFFELPTPAHKTAIIDWHWKYIFWMDGWADKWIERWKRIIFTCTIPLQFIYIYSTPNILETSWEHLCISSMGHRRTRYKLTLLGVCHVLLFGRCEG